MIPSPLPDSVLSVRSSTWLFHVPIHRALLRQLRRMKMENVCLVCLVYLVSLVYLVGLLTNQID
jgi:hypothetical protein